MSLDFEGDGAVLDHRAVDVADWLTWLEAADALRPGVRLQGNCLAERVGSASLLHSLVADLIGPNARPVRAILFDKAKRNNWALGWHQDRTIAVKARHDLAGFGPWTVKAGTVHVEPQFRLLERMVTIRIHLDEVGPENAPLRIAPGSHKLGKILERDYEGTIEACGEVECLAEASDVWLYATPILHASRAAVRPSRRRVIQIDYSADELPAPLAWAGV